MHTIDLLRGQGIPAKTTPGSAAMVVVVVAVPILAAAGMVDRYLQNKTDIEIKQQAIESEQETVDKFADDVKFQKSVEKERDTVNSKLSEVSSCLDNYIQWSPVLETLVRYLPAKMVMSGLRAESASERKKVVNEKDPNLTANVAVVTRTLVLDISGSGGSDYGSIVKTYANNLKSSSALRTKLEDIVVSQDTGRTGDDNTVTYTMNLKFKPGTL